jgi:hypothetical protein
MKVAAIDAPAPQRKIAAAVEKMLPARRFIEEIRDLNALRERIRNFGFMLLVLVVIQ